MKTLLVFSGGGLPGIDIHAGIGMVLSELGVEPEEIHGTSAGALYGALFAHNSFSGVKAALIIRELCDHHVRDPRFMWRSRFRHINHMMRGKKMRELIDVFLPPTFEDLPCEFYAYAVETNIEPEAVALLKKIKKSPNKLVAFSAGMLRPAVQASASIRGFFPPVRGLINSSAIYTDGGTINNVPLPAYWREFDRVYICIATQPVNYKVNGLIGSTMLSVHELMEAQVQRVYDEVGDDPRVVIIRPPVDGKTGVLHFNHTLIGQAYKYAKNLLSEHIRPPEGVRHVGQ